MATFTPPSLNEIPQIGGDEGNPLGNRLMRFYSPRPSGATVFKMSDGTYRIARQIPGLVGGPPVQDVWPSVQQAVTSTNLPSQPNAAINISWFYSAIVSKEVQTPALVYVYYGGHSYTVSAAEAASLTAAGLGAYLS